MPAVEGLRPSFPIWEVRQSDPVWALACLPSFSWSSGDMENVPLPTTHTFSAPSRERSHTHRSVSVNLG